MLYCHGINLLFCFFFLETLIYITMGNLVWYSKSRISNSIHCILTGVLTNGSICKLFLCLQNLHLWQFAYKRHMISIYRIKTMNLNKRSRRRRNVNMAQHEPLK